jgi:hypothetical protein
MTYEPGQRVLVRGVVKRPDQVAVGEVLIETHDADGNADRQYVRAADVVGPAPATPDDKPPGYCVLCGCPRWAPHSTDHDPQWVTGFFGEDGPAPATPDAGGLQRLMVICSIGPVEAAGTEGEGGHE